MHNIQCNKREKPETNTVKTYHNEYYAIEASIFTPRTKNRDKVEAKQGQMSKRVNEFIVVYSFKTVSSI